MKTYKDAFDSQRNFNSDKWEHYFDIYDHLLGKFYESKVNYLEIGVQNGGSLEIAKKLFASNSLIVGMDIDPDCKHLEGFDNYFIDIRSKEFEHLMNEPDFFHGQVLKAQQKIIPHFTKKIIGQRWISFFDKLSKPN